MINWQAGYAERCKSGLGGSLAETCPRKREKAPRRLPYPNFYYKADFTLDVTPLGGGESRRMECFAYIMNEGRPIGIPSDYYLQTCIEGYKHFGFDKRKLLRAVERMRRTLCKRKK